MAQAVVPANVGATLRVARWRPKGLRYIRERDLRMSVCGFSDYAMNARLPYLESRSRAPRSASLRRRACHRWPRSCSASSRAICPMVTSPR